MIFWVVLLCFSPFLVYLTYAFRRLLHVRRQINQLHRSAAFSQSSSRAVQISPKTYLNKELKQIQKVTRGITERAQTSINTTSFHFVKFKRSDSWNSPAYQFSVDATGKVLYEGLIAVRLLGCYQWRIHNDNLKAIEDLLKNSSIYELPEKHLSDIEGISKVTVDIYLKNGVHKTFVYDHASNYPIQLSTIERNLDKHSGAKKLWLEWKQNVSKFSLKKGKSFQYTYRASDKICLYQNGKKTKVLEANISWPELDAVLRKYNHLWVENSPESFYSHPQDSILLELENGFRFLITKHKYAAIYNELSEVVNQKKEQLVPS